MMPLKPVQSDKKAELVPSPSTEGDKAPTAFLPVPTAVPTTIAPTITVSQFGQAKEEKKLTVEQTFAELTKNQRYKELIAENYSDPAIRMVLADKFANTTAKSMSDLASAVKKAVKAAGTPDALNAEALHGPVKPESLKSEKSGLNSLLSADAKTVSSNSVASGEDVKSPKRSQVKTPKTRMSMERVLLEEPDSDADDKAPSALSIDELRWFLTVQEVPENRRLLTIARSVLHLCEVREQTKDISAEVKKKIAAALEAKNNKERDLALKQGRPARIFTELQTATLTGTREPTIEDLREATAQFKDDDTADKSPKLPLPEPQQERKSLEEIKVRLPRIAADDAPTFEAIGRLAVRPATEAMRDLGGRLVASFVELDEYWMSTLKPAARTKVRDMLDKVKEIGGMRGAVGEVFATAWACQTGGTKVGFGEDKLLEPDTFPKDAKPVPGKDSQDVDVSFTLKGDRVYVEAKYDMRTFLSKAHDTISRDIKPTASVTSVATSLGANPSVPSKHEAMEPAVVTSSSSTAAKTTEKAPKQLNVYEQVRDRTKTTSKPVKPKRLAVVIADPHDWVLLFLPGRRKLAEYMERNRWSLMVAGVDLIANRTAIGTKVEKMLAAVDERALVAKTATDKSEASSSSSSSMSKEGVEPESKTGASPEEPSSTSASGPSSPPAKHWVSFDGWGLEMSAKYLPRDFLTLKV